MTKSLLLKGLAGVAAVGGVVGGGFAFQEQIKGVFSSSSSSGAAKPAEVKSDENLDNLTHKELIDKVGLSCGLGESETEVGETPKDCTVKTEGTINVKRGDQTEEGVTFTANGSKLKVSKSDGYSKNLKFVVDSGDISLNKGGSAATTITKLEQFETYEIKKEGDKFYLSRKTEAKEEKIKALGLPSGCTLPESGDSNCSLDTAQIKKVKFQGHDGEGITVTNGNSISLKVTKMSDSTDFTDGYRFTFTFPSDVSINSKNLKANTPYDFKIKKGTGNTLTLEKAWADDNAFTKKAGLDCTNGSTTGCTVSSETQKLNIKVGTQTKEGITATTGTGKIKMETDQQGYNQGLKFTITTADVTWTTSTGDAITKLEELETYEITEDGGKYYLTRKGGKEGSIKSSLVLPKGCELPSNNSVECDISTDDFKNINFKDKASPASTGTVKLKISKANSTDFPLGYRFTFETTTDATIASSNKIKANIPTDFKIKKDTSGQNTTLTLENAWTETKFAEKVGLDCASQSDGCCSKSGSGQLNIKKGTDKKDGITGFSSATGSSGKIKVTKDQAGYNQGLKFTITGGNVTINGGSGASFTTLEEYETYEIKEEGDKYYLTRKTEASKTIGDLLGLPSSCGLSSTSPSCTLSTEQIKKVKFDGKDASGATMTSGTATLAISKETDTTKFPLGYKFTLQSQQEITIKSDQSNTNKVAANTPYEFKIKKNESDPTSLTLEKVWSADSLGKEVGLQSCSETNGCTINGSTLSVKQENNKDTNLTKSNGSGSSGKIKVEKDQAGYNQGFKFTIEDGIISLGGGTSTKSDDQKIKHLDEFETYEIKEDGGQWYLVRKDKAQVFIKKALGLDDIGGCSDFPKIGDSAPETCNNITDPNKLKKINFEGKEGHTWPTGNISVQLAVDRDTSNGNGLKFTFTDEGSTASTVCLPTGSMGGGVDLKASGNTSGVEYKIKKCKKGESVTLSLVKKDGSTGGNCK